MNSADVEHLVGGYDPVVPGLASELGLVPGLAPVLGLEPELLPPPAPPVAAVGPEGDERTGADH